MGAYEAYNYGNLAYKRDYASAEAAPSRRHARDLEIIEGGAHSHSQAVSPAHAFALLAAKVTVIGVLVFGILGFGRITLAAATVDEALAARQYESQLDVARSTISDLQVQQSTLSNPTRIKDEAKALGMSSPSTISVIDISGDVVAVDEEGNLSMTLSLKALEK